jgi:hypothetical protein
MTDALFDEADRIIIAAVDTAIEVGLGRTFDTPAGQTVRVTALEEKWVTLEPMVGGVPTGEVLHLPRDIRRIAVGIALARRNMTDAATRRN